MVNTSHRPQHHPPLPAPIHADSWAAPAHDLGFTLYYLRVDQPPGRLAALRTRALKLRLLAS